MRALGRVSAELLIPYSPGIPLWLKRERVTVAKLSQLEDDAHNWIILRKHRLHEKMYLRFEAVVGGRQYEEIIYNF